MPKLHTLLLVAVLIIVFPYYAYADNKIINELIYDGLGIDTGRSEAEVVGIHGPPATRTSKNQRPESIAEQIMVVELRYEDFSFTIHRDMAMPNPQETVILTRVFGQNIRMNHDLKIGSGVSAVQAILGAPDEVSYDSEKKYDYLYFPRVSAGDTPPAIKGEMLILSFTDDLLTQVSRVR